MSRAYFDHAATAALLPEARQAWLEAIELVGNPTGLHTSARRVKALLEDARESIAADLGAHPTEVIFTATGSQGDSIAVLGGRALRPDRPAVAISAVEHPGVATVATMVDEVRELPVGPDALVDLDRAADLVDEDVALVSVQAVNGEVGTVQALDEVVELGHRVGALVHSDAVQALALPGLDLAATGLDLASVAAHKIGGPVGIGALLARRELALPAAGLGAGQERGIVSGTPSAALAAGFAAALRVVTALRRDVGAQPLWEVRRRIVAAVADLAAVRVNGPADPARQVPGIVHVTIDGVRADDVLFLLDSAGVDASTGASCRAGMHQPSDVVLAMTGSPADASSSIRLSFGWETSPEEVDRLVEVLPGIIGRARAAAAR
ncbi:cysteine desulfurase family protein [Propionibacteriaceae bacterium Y1923]|uniref:cysteine desulfurase family protein n=1 Tax=Aestuariimicrobium sp. Y1814 TaxID=3418742 RepID=UPI003C14D833